MADTKTTKQSYNTEIVISGYLIVYEATETTETKRRIRSLQYN
jgi:hypothetical protein